MFNPDKMFVSFIYIYLFCGKMFVFGPVDRLLGSIPYLKKWKCYIHLNNLLLNLALKQPFIVMGII